MNAFIRFSIAHKIAVIAALVSVFLFGLLAMQTIPIQMTPDIEKPIYQVRVSWPGASPEDIDREIVNRLENELGSLAGIETIDSRSFTGSARITLTYSLNQNMDEALVLLLSKLSGITGLPDDSKRPTVRTSNSDDSPIARLALVAMADEETGTIPNVEQLGSFLETGIQEPLSRVQGVAEVSSFGGGEKELRLLLDPEKLSRYRLSVAEVIRAVRGASKLVSIGAVDEGKRSYAVRFESLPYTPETVKQIIVRNEITEGGAVFPVFLGDVADVRLDVQKRSSFRRLNGKDAVIINLLREQGSNVVETMDRVKAVVDDLNATSLNPRGLQLRIVYNETNYISSALDLVQQNIYIGGFFALIILMLFLRSVLPTVIIFIAIPASVVGTFVAIAGLGLSINVISLAGLAFAVGMVVDASIVSLENIYRHRQSGYDAPYSAYHGARQVWAPILGASLTTVIVFIPILMVDLPVGQLFRDIGIAIAVAVLISAVVSVTVIPTISASLLKGDADRFSTMMAIPLLDPLAQGFRRLIVKYAQFITQRLGLGLGLVALILSGSIVTAYLIMPKLDYLPDGNANFVFARISVPPGYSLEETSRIARKMENSAKPLWQEDVSPEEPAIDRFFFVAYGGGAFAGASAKDGRRVRELSGLLTEPLQDEPGTRAFARQSSLFGRSVGGSRSINVIVSGPDVSTIENVTRALDEKLNRRFPRKDGNQIRVRPGLNSQVPQIRVEPDQLALARAGFTVADFVTAVDVFNDGMAVSEIPLDGELIDLVVAGKKATELSIDDLSTLPIVSPLGQIYNLDQLAEISIISAPMEILRHGGRQMMEVQLRPHEGLTIEDAVAQVEEEITLLRQEETNLDGIAFDISGAAGDLQQTWQALKINLVIVVGVILLLLSILMRSFILPLTIFTVVPISAAGGIFGLFVLNQFIRQSLDMLTMLGFIILIGVVVNNAILMVEQTILHIKEDRFEPRDAVIEATKNRIRPIMMSSLTSLFGLIPLVIFPGAGAELYRGIGAVVFGGLLVSVIATLIIIPPMLTLFAGVLKTVAASGDAMDFDLDRSSDKIL